MSQLKNHVDMTIIKARSLSVKCVRAYCYSYMHTYMLNSTIHVQVYYYYELDLQNLISTLTHGQAFVRHLTLMRWVLAVTRNYFIVWKLSTVKFYVR